MPSQRALALLGPFLLLSCGPSGVIQMTGRPSSSSGGISTSTSGSGIGGSTNSGASSGTGGTSSASSASGSSGATGTSGNASSGASSGSGASSSGSGSGSSSGAASGSSSGGACSNCTADTDCQSGWTCSIGTCIPPRACDQALLTFTGPVSNTDGTCLTDLAGFYVYAAPYDIVGAIADGGYFQPTDVGLPCIAGPQMACGDGGSEDQLSCAVELSGLTDGTWYFAVEAYDVFGGTSAPSGEVSKAISCGMNGANCTSGADCPPFQACDTTKGVCSSVCDAGNCACNSDRQCNGGYMSQLAPLGTEAWFGVGLTCRNSLCVPGCANAGDCPLGMGCDLATGSCVSDCQGNACACDVDSQCRGIYGTEIGYSCTACGTCAQQCKSARDCDGTHACDLSSGFPGTCGTNCPNCLCETDSQCNGGQTGLNVICSGGDGSDIPTPSMPGHCIPGCHYASDCDATQACTAFCVDPTSCGDGVCQTVCDAGCQCLNSQQCNGGNSGLGLFCEPDAGQCIPGCSANSDCASGICNLTNYPGTCQ